MRPRSLILVLACAAGLALAPAANAKRTVSPTPVSGDFNNVFSFAGKGWQGRQRMTVNYYQVLGATHPFKSFSFVVPRSGQFNFNFTNPVVAVNQGRTAQLCFRQFNTSTRKTYQVCSRFYVQPANARAEPDTVARGGSFLIHISGWAPGNVVVAEVTGPGGAASYFQTGEVTTRTNEAFVDQGSPFGPVFIPKGGAVVKLQIFTDNPVGIYSVFVHLKGDSSAGSRTAFNVT
jgi:hypothetical protein